MMSRFDRRIGGVKLIDWIRLCVLVVLFSSSFLMTKTVGRSIPAFTGVTTRVTLGGLLMLMIVFADRRRMPPLMRDGWLSREWTFLILMGIVGNATPFFLIYWGQQEVASSVAGILMALMPLTTLALAHFFVPGEHMTPRKAIGFTTGFVGLVVLFSPNLTWTSVSGAPDLWHLIAILGGAILFAVNGIIARHTPPMSSIVSSAGILPAAALFLMPFALVNDHSVVATLVPATGAVTALMTLSIFTTAFATIVYMQLITSAGPTFLSQVNYLVPIFAVGIGIVLGNETPQATSLVALVFILSGIAVSQSRPVE